MISPLYRLSPLGSSSSSWSSYWTQRSLFFLDGTIIDVGGIKYFKDKSSAERNFLITGYDFDSTWTKGFPYKSGATLSAPIADAELIAADLNNFLYAVDETPNEIPVISLFQDIDYEHKIFCKHVAQILNVDDAESYEPRVLEIYMAEVVESGNVLIRAQTYFGVPVVISDSKYISKAGNDANGGTSWVDSVLTFLRGLTLVTTSRTLYSRTGIYSEHIRAKEITQGLGRVETLAQTDYAAYPYDNSSLKGVILNANSKNHAFYLTASTKCYLEKNFLIGAIGYTIETLNDNTLIKLKDCIIKGYNDTVYLPDSLVYSNGGIELDTCLITGECGSYAINLFGAAKDKIIKYSMIDCIPPQVVIYIQNSANYNFVGNRFISTNAIVYLMSMNTGVYVGNLVFKNNYFNLPALTNTLLHFVNSSFDVKIQNNIFIVTNIPAYPILLAGGQNSFIVKNNIFRISDLPAANSAMQLTATGNKVLTCNNNSLYGKAGLLIYYASTNVGTVNGNKCISTAILSLNCLNIYQSAILSVNYNYCIGSPFHISFNYCRKVFETQTAYNLLVDCRYGYFVSQGSNNILAHNNTIIRNSLGGGYSGGFYAFFVEEWDVTATPTENYKIKNNIMIFNGDYDGVSNLFKFVFLEQVSNIDGFECDYNIYYSTRTDGKMFAIGVNMYTFAEWQALGYDAHSILLTSESQMKSLFNDYDGGDYTLKTGSPAIGAGVDLGATYKTGLQLLTDWGGDNDIDTPFIVTKEQGANWDIGAFISSVNTVPNGNPSDLVATVISPEQVDLSCTAGSTDEEGFIWERRVGNLTYKQIAATKLPAYSDTDTVEGTLYDYRVRSYKGTQYSNYSNVVSANTSIAPSGLTLTVISGIQINLSCTDNSSNEDGFAWERSLSETTGFTEIARTDPNIVSYIDSEVEDNTRYYYRVRSFRRNYYSAYSSVENILTFYIAGYTKLLLHLDNNITDSSIYAKVVTPTGITYDNTGGKFSYYAIFNGTSSKLIVPASDDWNFGTSNFTIDCWVYVTDITKTSQGIMRLFLINNDRLGFCLDAGKLVFFCRTTAGGWLVSITSTGKVTQSAWNHVAIVRYGNIFTLYINGVPDGTVTTNITMPDLGVTLDIGMYAYSITTYFTDRIDEFRVSKGIARWTADFSASLPAAPYDAD
jgi:hypothetical protein